MAARPAWSCFDAPRTWRALAPKLIRGCALDALDEPDDPVESDAAADARALIDALTSSETTNVPAVGEGEDVRFNGAGVLGAGLCRWRQRAMHALEDVDHVTFQRPAVLWPAHARAQLLGNDHAQILERGEAGESAGGPCWRPDRETR